MANPYSSAPLTLQVRDLAQATSFYLATLSPLGYGFVSEVQHRTSTANSKAVGLGPAGSSRVDVFLSQALHAGAGPPNNAHVVFPATSTIAVREFYAAALQAGGRPVARPNNLDSSDGMFASIISDIDGNRVEVCYAGETQAVTSVNEESANASVVQPGGSIERWRDGVTGNSVTESVASSETPKAARSAKPTNSFKSAISTAKSLAASEPVKAAMTVATAAASSQASSKRSDSQSKASRGSRRNSITGTPSINAGNKTVVGTLIGAAAGAALAYTVVRSKKGSAEQEDEHERRLRSMDAKAEARAHCRARDRQRATGKVELADRDSGYGSGSQYSNSPPMLNHRSATFPQPSNAGHSSRGRSSTRKYFDYSQRAMSPEQYYENRPARRQSVGGSSSHSTAKPVQRSQSNGSRRNSSSRRLEAPPGPPTPPPAPSMPEPPPARSRRGSISNQAGGVSRKSSVKEKPPSSFQRAMGLDATRSEASKAEGAPSSYYSSKSALDSRQAPSDTRSTSTVRRAASMKSSSSAKNAPVQEPSRPTGPSRQSSLRAQMAQPTPSQAPKPLTSKALSYRDRVELQERGNKWDELATVVPDDSISCASEREERLDKEARAARRPQRRDSRGSRRSSYRER